MQDPPVPEEPPGDSDAGTDESVFAAAEDALASLREDIALVVEDARTYAEAEIAFQKTRASVAGKTAGHAVAMVVLALVLLHIALIALAVGVVIALAPFVTIWGAIAIVVGALLIGAALLGLAARRDGEVLARLFASAKGDGA